MTLDELIAFGADVEDGLARCMGNEELYLRLVETMKGEKGFDELQTALAADDLESAFQAAHTLKGVLGNLSLTPLYSPVAELTEHLRARKDMDYSGYLQKVSARFAALRALCED